MTTYTANSDTYIDTCHFHDHFTDNTSSWFIPASEIYHSIMSVAAWHGSDITGCINKVTLHRARLVLGWVTVFRWSYHLNL